MRTRYGRCPIASPPQASSTGAAFWTVSRARKSLVTTRTRSDRSPSRARQPLKLKEASDLHAELSLQPNSSNGPIALVSLVIRAHVRADRRTPRGMTQLAADLTAKGAAAFITSSEESTPDRLPALPPDHPETDAICLIQSFYAMVVRLAAVRGRNADRPRHTCAKRSRARD